MLLGERNFSLDSLKSILNCDMEEKGIVLQELSCRSAARASAAVRQLSSRLPARQSHRKLTN